MTRVTALTVAAAFSVCCASLRAHAQCPALGADTICGSVITITDKGATVSQSGQGPYDGSDDTLVGVINNSSIPVYAIGLTSTTDIFGFDGDGIDTYGAPGNTSDSTGYGGPNSYFTSINSSQTTGTVNFIKPLAAHGGTTYFSLEESLSTATACSSLINNALKTQASGANICATFTPNFGYTLKQAAALCGVSDFDWLQLITKQFDPSAFYARNLGGAYKSSVSGSVRLTSKEAPWNDPPQGGGYAPGAGGTGTPDNSYPFYYDHTGELAGHENGSSVVACSLPNIAGKTLTLHDAPGDTCLPGGSGVGTATCDGTGEPKGSYGGFWTRLAGVKADGTALDLGIGFTWTSNYNGTTGGVAIKKTDQGADGNGTGGITITGVNQVSNYQYPSSFGITSVNGIAVPSSVPNQAVLGGNQVTMTASGLAYSRSTQTFNGTVTLTNVTQDSLDGPFQIVFTTLTPGVILTGATGSFGGFPYLTVASASSLIPGASVTIPVQFKNPTLGQISFIPVAYTGSLN